MTADVQRRQAARSRSRGFTLIEVMITVAIVAILAAVALPGYQSYIRKTNRADGTSMLQSIGIAQERYRLGSTTYGTLAQLQAANCKCSGTSERGHYTLDISDVSATGYKLTANPASSIQQADTDCKPITMTVNGGTTTFEPGKCWGK